VKWGAAPQETREAAQGRIEEEKPEWVLYATRQWELAGNEGFPEYFSLIDIRKDNRCESLQLKTAGKRFFYYFLNGKLFAVLEDPETYDGAEILEKLQEGHGTFDEFIPIEGEGLPVRDEFGNMINENEDKLQRFKRWIWQMPNVRMTFIWGGEFKIVPNSYVWDGEAGTERWILYEYISIMEKMEPQEPDPESEE
jgi:hypothetical protein